MIVENKNLIDEYNKLYKNIDFQNVFIPKLYVPIPNEGQYKNGFIDRYFCKKIGDENNIITEISYEDSRSIEYGVVKLYNIISLRWKISGPKNNIFENKILKVEGVEDYNKKIVNDVESKMTGLKTFFNNRYLEFWRKF